MEADIKAYEHGDKLKFKDYLLGKIQEFAGGGNPCHGPDGKFCETHGVTHGEGAGTPGGTRAGEVDGKPGTQLATARPSAAGSKYKAGDIVRLGFDTIPDDAIGDKKKGNKIDEGIVTRLSKVPGFEDFAGRTDRGVLTEIAQRQSENIEDMFNTAQQIGTDTSKAHSDWYPFVNRWAHEESKADGHPSEAIMAAAAVLSPSADWANNVAWTRTVAQVVANEKNITVSKEWMAANDLAAQASYKMKQAIHERNNKKLIAEGKEPKEFTIDKPVIGANDSLIGKRMSDLTPENAAIAMRGAHEAFGKAVHQLGGAAGLGDSKNIATPQSIPNFAKAISILRDPSAKNIDTQLGGNHKVRSFFQNMRDPYNTTSADVTVDSHHMGMALGIPITGTSPIMKRVYDGPKRAETGLVGTYPITVEATRMATERINKKHGTNYTPAQIQSITWEAQRALYDKKIPAMQKAIGEVRTLFSQGKITRPEMLARVETARLAKYGKSPQNKTLEQIRGGFLRELKKGKG